MQFGTQNDLYRFPYFTTYALDYSKEAVRMLSQLATAGTWGLLILVVDAIKSLPHAACSTMRFGSSVCLGSPLLSKGPFGNCECCASC